jgi:hypothetical protein
MTAADPATATTGTHVLLARGEPRFQGTSLSELARRKGAAAAWMQAFAQDGERAPAQVAGDFSVAVATADGTVHLAVDRFAIRSLCYRLIDGRLHVAERADELAALSPRADIDPQAIYDYLYFHVIPSPRTIFRGVHRLPPAHRAVFRNGSLQVTPYWTPAFDEIPNPDFGSLAETFRRHVREAVAAQLDGSKPGCFLSGGTDSSTVAGMLGAAAGRQAATYSIGFEAEGYDEMQFARIAAKRFGTEHHEYYVTPDDLVRGIPDVAAHYDQPFGNSQRAAGLLLREDGARDRRHAAAGRRRRRRTLRRQQPLCQAAHLRLVRPGARPAAQGPARAGAAGHAARRAAAGPQGAQLHRAGARAPARPHADVQPAAAPGPWRGLQPGLPGAPWTRPTRTAPAAGGMAAGHARQCAEPHAGLRLALHAGRGRPAQGLRQHRAGRRGGRLPFPRPGAAGLSRSACPPTTSSRA